MNSSDIEAAFENVQRALRDLDSPSEESRQALEAIVKSQKEWFSSNPRIATEAAESCIEYFLNAEFDGDTPGNRGLGRLSEYIPRLAAHHRSVFRGLAPKRLAELRRLVKQHILCGYLFLEANTNLVRANGDLSSSLLKMWIPMIYSSSGREPGRRTQKARRELRMGEIPLVRATSKHVRDQLSKIGIAGDPKDGRRSHPESKRSVYNLRREPPLKSVRNRHQTNTILNTSHEPKSTTVFDLKYRSYDMFTIIQEFTEKYCGFRGSLFSIHPLSGCERLRKMT